MKYRSYEDAQKRGDKDVWPGCGKLGRCMPCGRIHNFDYQTRLGGSWIDRYQCAQNHDRGCPQPHPEPKHDWHGTTCRRCKAKRPKLTSTMLHLLRRAAKAAEDGTRVHGRGKVGTARALDERGLINFSEHSGACWTSRAYITKAGREALALWGLA
jgi:hypothetical protein